MATKTRRKYLKIGVHVIGVTCPCGGMCENETGSTMIEESEKVRCLDCGECYEISVDAFKKFRQLVGEQS